MSFERIIINLSILITFTFLYGVTLKYFFEKKVIKNILIGVMLGLVSVLSMIFSFELTPGLIFDGRSIILGISGILGGFTSAIIAVLITSIYRASLGGLGMLTGLLVIIFSGIAGVLFNFFVTSKKTFPKVYLFGLFLHIFIILIFYITIPGPNSIIAIKAVWKPFILIYPFVTVIICYIFTDQINSYKAQQEIKQTSILLQSSIESPKDMIILSLDSDYRYLYFNNAHAIDMKNVYGTTPQIGDCIFDYITEKSDVEKVKHHYDLALRGEGHTSIDEYGSGQNKFYYEVHYNPILNQHNKIIGLTSFAQNITESIKAREDIKKAKEKIATITEKSEARYKELFENMNAGFVLFEVVLNNENVPVDLIILAANNKFEQTTGLNIDDVLGKPLTEALPGIEKDEANWIETYGEVALTGKMRQFEQGSELLGYYYNVNAFKVGPKQCAVTFLDITERITQEKHNLERMERTEEQRNLIAQLSFDYEIINKHIDEALKILTTRLAEILKVERTSVWLLSEDDALLKRKMLFDSNSGIDNKIEVLNTAEFPSYFKALYKNSQIDADDAQNDPRTKELNDIYFVPLKISSMLDTAIQRDGKIIGVLSAEHRGPIRNWRTDEESFVSALTNFVSQLIANAERVQAENNLQNAYDEIASLRDQLQAENIYLKKKVKSNDLNKDIIGNSPSLLGVVEKALLVAKQNSTVLIIGETGTGKELIANGIHSASNFKNGPFVTINCAAIPDTLIESELFGHEKGAFTGAEKKKLGLFEIASEGTIFLDEIGELPLQTQSKLLRVIENRSFTRLGGKDNLRMTARILAATNRNLSELIDEGKFRSDLYYRLNVFSINVPPLRERIDDIPLLIEKFVSDFNSQMGKQIKTISKDSLKILKIHLWPGNVRELKNVIERAMISSKGKKLIIEELFRDEKKITLKSLEDVDRNHILQVLNSTNWKISGKNGAAEILNLKPTTLRSKIEKLGIQRN